MNEAASSGRPTPTVPVHPRLTTSTRSPPQQPIQVQPRPILPFRQKSAPQDPHQQRIILPSIGPGGPPPRQQKQAQPQQQAYGQPGASGVLPSSPKNWSEITPNSTSQAQPQQNGRQPQSGRAPSSPSTLASTPSQLRSSLPTFQQALGHFQVSPLSGLDNSYDRGQPGSTPSLGQQHPLMQQASGSGFAIPHQPAGLTTLPSLQHVLHPATSPSAYATLLLPFLSPSNAQSLGTFTVVPIGASSSSTQASEAWSKGIPMPSSSAPSPSLPKLNGSGYGWPLLSTPTTEASQSSGASGLSDSSIAASLEALHPNAAAWPSANNMIWAAVHMLGVRIAAMGQRGLSGTITEEEKAMMLAHITELVTCAGLLKLSAPQEPASSTQTTPTAESSASVGTKRKAPSDGSGSPFRSSRSPLRTIKEEVVEAREPLLPVTRVAGPVEKKSCMLSISSIVNEPEHHNDVDEVRSADSNYNNWTRSAVDEEEDGALGLSMLIRGASMRASASTPPIAAPSRSPERRSPADPHLSSSSSPSAATEPKASKEVPPPSPSSPLSSLPSSPLLTSWSTTPAASTRRASPSPSLSPSLKEEETSAEQSPSKAKKAGGRRRKRCAHCGCSNSSVWRRGYDNVILCNACGLRWARNKRKSGIDDETAARRTRGPRVSWKNAAPKRPKHKEEDEDDEEESEDAEEGWLEEDSDDYADDMWIENEEENGVRDDAGKLAA